MTKLCPKCERQFPEDKTHCEKCNCKLVPYRFQLLSYPTRRRMKALGEDFPRKNQDKCDES